MIFRNIVNTVLTWTLLAGLAVWIAVVFILYPIIDFIWPYDCKLLVGAESTFK